MSSILGIFLLLAAREPFPATYTPSPCAPAEAVAAAGRTFPQSEISQIAALRGYDVGQEWVDAHWKELSDALTPIWAKAATCYATAANDNLYCNDIAQEEAFAICNRYEGSDREKCTFAMTAVLAGQDNNSKEAWTAMRPCLETHKPNAERTLEWWLDPPAFGASYPGWFRVHAVDSVTRVPVQARLHIESAQQIYAEDVPNGLPTTFYKVPWKQIKLFRVPNAAGHRDVVAPQVRIEAPGYRSESFRLPVEVAAMKIEMKPAKLKRGKNSVTVTAVDSITGKPIEARVMGGELVLGKTNEPFEIEIKGKRPEIWVTNLYDRYSDVVVVPAEK
ncbi:MAG TPA: hypothetical protein VNI54_02705 [Thermoanaerobaculia bacterium]|nr:hypothetical protein [Thermoanaerobaculia bacterium]